RRLKCLDALLGSPKGHQRSIDPRLQIRLPNVLDLVKDLSKTKADGTSLDVSVDRPQRLDVRLLGAGEGGVRRSGDRSAGGYRFATRRDSFPYRGKRQYPKKGH